VLQESIAGRQTLSVGPFIPFLVRYATQTFNSGMKMNASTVKAFARAIKFGSKYVYQTVPRLLTIWLDLGEDRKMATQETFRKLNDVVAKIIKEAPVYKASGVPTVKHCILMLFSGLLRSPKSSREWDTRTTMFTRICRD
jgi:hypothetical protein